MTESTAPVSPESTLTSRHQDALNRFIVLWGEMATHWGINRTMAQIHALLYASEHPLDTDEIMERLQVSRGNANMNLRSLVDWNLVFKTQQPGSRKDFYTAEKDVWKITTTIIEERRKREIMPVQQALQACAQDLQEGSAPTPEEAQFAQRIDNLVDFLEVFDGFTGTLLPLVQGRDPARLRKLVQFAARLRKGSDDSNA